MAAERRWIILASDGRHVTLGRMRKALAARRGTLPTLPLLGLLALCPVWGLSIPATKLGLQSFPPLMLAACRYAVAAPFFALFLIGRPIPSRRALLAMAGLCIIGIDVGQVAQILGVQQTEASVATVISAAIPIFVVLLGSWRLRQPLRAAHLAGLGVAMGGIAVIASKGPVHTFQMSASELLGDVALSQSVVDAVGVGSRVALGLADIDLWDGDAALASLVRYGTADGRRVGKRSIAPRHWFLLTALALLVTGCTAGGAAGPVSPASSAGAMSSSATGTDHGGSDSGGTGGRGRLRPAGAGCLACQRAAGDLYRIDRHFASIEFSVAASACSPSANRSTGFTVPCPLAGACPLQASPATCQALVARYG